MEKLIDLVDVGERYLLVFILVFVKLVIELKLLFIVKVLKLLLTFE